jgi:hypothetical protein
MITHLIPETGSLHNVIYYGLSLCCCLLFILLVITAEKKELEKIGFFRKVLYR